MKSQFLWIVLYLIVTTSALRQHARRHSGHKSTVEAESTTTLYIEHHPSASTHPVNSHHHQQHQHHHQGRTTTPSVPIGGEFGVLQTLEITSHIVCRFALTTVVAELWNADTVDRQIDFELLVPESAFISNFTMTVGDKLLVADVLERGEARAVFEDAVNRSQLASLVSTKIVPPLERLRDMEWFVVDVNVPASSSVLVTLSYQEVLNRRLGFYQQRISVRPKQIVPRLSVDVSVTEPQGLVWMTVQEPSKSDRKNVTSTSNRTTSVVRFSPTVAEQNLTGGISGDLVVQYDVDHGSAVGGGGGTGDGGLFLSDGKYFVHFFVPTGLRIVGKRLVFVVDVSGSMHGEKIAQARQAMLTMLSQLGPDDEYQLILFDDKLKFWPADRRTARVAAHEIGSAKRFVKDEVVAVGGTDINLALMAAFETAGQPAADRTSMIVFLTDGEPTSGVTDPERIRQNVRRQHPAGVPVYALGFGLNLNFKLLRVIAEETGGDARRIYDGVDAAVQLERFLLEVNSPVMFDVRMTYPESAVVVGSTTTQRFVQCFDGSEILVAGRLLPSAPRRWSLTVDGRAVGQNVTLTKIVDADEQLPSVLPDEFDGTSVFERLYVDLKIKDLLRRELVADGRADADKLRDYALRLALEYHLVTPLTSLSIVNDNRNEGSWRNMEYDYPGVVGRTRSFSKSSDVRHMDMFLLAGNSGHVVSTLTARVVPVALSAVLLYLLPN